MHLENVDPWLPGYETGFAAFMILIDLPYSVCTLPRASLSALDPVPPWRPRATVWQQYRHPEDWGYPLESLNPQAVAGFRNGGHLVFDL